MRKYIFSGIPGKIADANFALILTLKVFAAPFISLHFFYLFVCDASYTDTHCLFFLTQNPTILCNK